MSFKKIIQQGDSSALVLNYEPREFPVKVTKSATDFVSSQKEKVSDFQISELVADQVGINEIQRQSIEKAIEEKALARVKDIEERAYKEAYDLGLIEGTEKAFQMRKAELEERVQDINSLLMLFQDIKRRLVIENEQALVKLATAIASKIAMHEIQGQEDTILTLLKTVADELQAEDTIHVTMSDDDLFFLESLREKTDHQIELLDRLKVESSTEIASGGCIVETNHGSIDARVKNRVDRAWEVINGRLPSFKEKKGLLANEHSMKEQDSSSDDDSDEGNGGDSGGVI
jgi:flagellar assembly protein FliH